MRALLKDPLVHFLVAGALLFVVASAVNPPKTPDDRIIVDRAALLQFIQYRSKAFEANAAADFLDSLDAEARARLVDSYVREEALVREAKSLGLEENDYVIRQRLMQKAEFLAEATAPVIVPDEKEIAAYYAENSARYLSPPSATLTHVFVSFDGKPPAAARAKAGALLAKLKADHAGFNDAPAYGDRFLFHKNYVERTDDYIASQLGDEVAAAVFDAGARLDDWRGPYRSQYGYHLIFITDRTAARLPPLAEIHDLVLSDLAEDLRQDSIEKAIATIVAKYGVDNRLDAGD